MKFNREELLETLNQCKPAIGSGTHIPELAYLWFDGGSVCAYDGDGVTPMGIRRKLDSDLECGVHGTTLLNLLKTSSLKEVELEHSGTVTVRMGRFKAVVATMPLDRKVFPYPTRVPKKDGLVLSDGVFDAFKRLQVIKPRPAAQVLRVEQGIVMDVQHDFINAIATDQISVAQQTVKVHSVSMPKFIIPWNMVHAICTLLEGTKEPKLWLMDDCILAGRVGTTIACSIADLSDSPNVHEAMAAQHVAKAAPVPKGLRTTLERACILAGAEEPNVVLEVAKGALSVRGKFALGRLNETLELKGKASPGILKLRANLVLRALEFGETMHVGGMLSLTGDEGNFKYLLNTKPEEKEE